MDETQAPARPQGRERSPRGPRARAPVHEEDLGPLTLAYNRDRTHRGDGTETARAIEVGGCGECRICGTASRRVGKPTPGSSTSSSDRPPMRCSMRQGSMKVIGSWTWPQVPGAQGLRPPGVWARAVP